MSSPSPRTSTSTTSWSPATPLASTPVLSSSTPRLHPTKASASPEFTLTSSSPDAAALSAVNKVIDDFSLALSQPHADDHVTEVEEDMKIVETLDAADSTTAGTVRTRLEDHFDASALTETESETDADSKDLKSDSDSKTSPTSFFDVRIAVVGNVDAGKSTLIGVLTSGKLDDGRGMARSRVFLHKHEHENGRTSCISQHIMGFTANNEPVYNNTPASSSAAAKTKAWTAVVSNSAHVATFIDLAGHEKYLKTTIAGLTGCYPDYALVIINSLAGITKMTKEHLGVVLALHIPLICIVSKIDLVPENVLARTKTQLFKVLKSPAAQKMPLQIKSSKDVDIAVENSSARICPVFFISCVSGTHINLIHEFISKLTPRRDEWIQTMASQSPSASLADGTSSATTPAAAAAVEFSIDEIFNVTGVGVVVSGTVQRGKMVPNTTLLLGPYSDGSFRPVYVRTLHCKRVPVDYVSAGDSCAISLRSVGRKDQISRSLIRRGMALVDPSLNPHASTLFESEVHILHHPTTIKLGYQCVIHSGMVRQAAALIHIDRDVLRTGDKAICRFRFLMRAEYLHNNTTFIFREGSTKGIGKITKTQFTREEIKEAIEQEIRMKRGRKPPAGSSGHGDKERDRAQVEATLMVAASDDDRKNKSTEGDAD